MGDLGLQAQHLLLEMSLKPLRAKKNILKDDWLPIRYAWKLRETRIVSSLRAEDIFYFREDCVLVSVWHLIHPLFLWLVLMQFVTYSLYHLPVLCASRFPLFPSIKLMLPSGTAITALSLPWDCEFFDGVFDPCIPKAFAQRLTQNTFFNKWWLIE